MDDMELESTMGLQSLQDSEGDSNEDELPIALSAYHRRLRTKKKKFPECLEEEDDVSHWNLNTTQSINSLTAEQARAVGLGLRQRRNYIANNDSDSNESMDDQSIISSYSKSSSCVEEADDEEYEQEDSDGYDSDDFVEDSGPPPLAYHAQQNDNSTKTTKQSSAAATVVTPDSKPIKSFHKKHLPPDLLYDIEQWVLNKMLPDVYAYCAAPNSNPAKANYEYRQPGRYQWSKVKSTSNDNTWMGYGYGLGQIYVTTGIHHTEFKIQKFGKDLEAIGAKLEKCVNGELNRRNINKNASFNHVEIKIYTKRSHLLSWHNDWCYSDKTKEHSESDTASDDSVNVSVSIGGARKLLIKMLEKDTDEEDGQGWKDIKNPIRRKILMQHGSYTCFVSDDDCPTLVSNGKLQKTQHSATYTPDENDIDMPSIAIVFRNVKENKAVEINEDGTIHGQEREGKKAEGLVEAIRLYGGQIQKVFEEHRAKYRAGICRSSENYRNNPSRPIRVRVLRNGLKAKLWKILKRQIKAKHKRNGKIIQADGPRRPYMLVELKKVSKYYKGVHRLRSPTPGSIVEVTGEFLWNIGWDKAVKSKHNELYSTLDNGGSGYNTDDWSETEFDWEPT